MQYAIKETVRLHANVLTTILEIPTFLVDQSVQQIASVQRQNHAGIINAMIHALEYVEQMHNAKLSIIFQTACVLQGMSVTPSQHVVRRKYVCFQISNMGSLHL